jgi:hypothetical protein
MHDTLPMNVAERLKQLFYDVQNFSLREGLAISL